MTQHVWPGQSATVDPASVAPRPNEVIAGLDPAIHDAAHSRLSHSVAPRLNDVAGLDPAIQHHSLNIIMDARVKPAHDSACVARPECHGGPGKCDTASQRVIAGLVPGMTVKLHI